MFLNLLFIFKFVDHLGLTYVFVLLIHLELHHILEHLGELLVRRVDVQAGAQRRLRILLLAHRLLRLREAVVPLDERRVELNALLTGSLGSVACVASLN